MEQPRTNHTNDPAVRLSLEVFDLIGTQLSQSAICPRLNAIQLHWYRQVNRTWCLHLKPFFLRLPLLVCPTGQRCNSWRCPWCSPNPDPRIGTDIDRSDDVHHSSFHRKLIKRLLEKPLLLKHVRQIYLHFCEYGGIGKNFVQQESIVLTKLMDEMPELRSIQITAPAKYGTWDRCRFDAWLAQMPLPSNVSNLTSLAIPIGLIDDIPSFPSYPNVRDLSLSGRPSEVYHYHPDLKQLTTWVATMTKVECLRFSHSLRLNEYLPSMRELYFTCRIRNAEMDELMNFYSSLFTLPNLEVLSLLPAPITGIPPMTYYPTLRRTDVVLPPVACRNLKTLAFAEDEVNDSVGKLMIIGLLRECRALINFSYFGPTLDNRFTLPATVTYVRHGPPPVGRSHNDRRVLWLGHDAPSENENATRSINELCAILSSSPVLRLVHLEAENIVHHIRGKNCMASFLNECPSLDRLRFSSERCINENLYKTLGVEAPDKTWVTVTDHECEIDIRSYRRYRDEIQPSEQ